MSKVKTYDQQTAFDVALQEYGSLEGLFSLLKANQGLSLDSAIAAGSILKIDSEVLNQPLVTFYKDNNIKPATGSNLTVVFDNTPSDMITQTLNYSLAGGDETFPGQKLTNLDGQLDMQINYSGIDAADVKVYVDQSLDGISYSAIPGAEYTLDQNESSHIFNFLGLNTEYVRLRVEAGSATAGTITTIIYKV